MNINDNVPFAFRQLRPKNMPKKTAEMITRLAQAYGLENIGEIDEQFLNGFTCASEIVIAQLEKEFESGNKGEWIPIEEREPEVHKYVMFTTKTTRREIGYKAKEEPYYFLFGDSGAYVKSDFILAWMELPEPYKAESEGV